LQFVLDWCEDYLDYRHERGLGDPAPEMTERLAAILDEYHHRMGEGRFSEASALMQWLVPPSCFILRDPQDDWRYECIQTADGRQVRVVSAYGPEEVELEPREMPEVSDEVVAALFADHPARETAAESVDTQDPQVTEEAPGGLAPEAEDPTVRDGLETTAR